VLAGEAGTAARAQEMDGKGDGRRY
jgi:hypothetical protein